MSLLSDIRDDVEDLLAAAVPAEVAVWPLMPDDVLEAPAVGIDLITLSRGFELPTALLPRVTVHVIAGRVDTASAVHTLDDLTSVVVNALGGGTGVSLPTAKGQLRFQTATVSNIQVGDTTWPTITIESDVTVASGFC